MTGAGTLSWCVGFLGLLAWLVFVGLMWRGRADVGPREQRPPGPRASMRLLFVEEAEAGIVVDGMVALEGARLGTPTTWLLAPPAPEVPARRVLRRWADEDAELDLDLAALCGPRPALAMSHDGVILRLAMRRRLTRIDGAVGHP